MMVYCEIVDSGFIYGVVEYVFVDCCGFFWKVGKFSIYGYYGV